MLGQAATKHARDHASYHQHTHTHNTHTRKAEMGWLFEDTRGVFYLGKTIKAATEISLHNRAATSQALFAYKCADARGKGLFWPAFLGGESLG